jgi:hypothetical protein
MGLVTILGYFQEKFKRAVYFECNHAKKSNPNMELACNVPGDHVRMERGSARQLHLIFDPVV